MELGPLQRRWIEALESGRYVQGTGMLVREKAGGNEYCCLGVACEIFGWDGGYNELLTDEEFKALGLLGQNGQGRPALNREPEEKYSTLTRLNDNGCSFKEIAALLRGEPERYFSESK